MAIYAPKSSNKAELNQFYKEVWAKIRAYTSEKIKPSTKFPHSFSAHLKCHKLWYSLMYPRANTCWLQMYSEAAQEAVLLHMTFPKASLCWLCPISASYWEPITNDSCSLVFFSQLHTCIINSIVNVAAFSLLHIVFFVNVPPAFDKHTTSPIYCVLTLSWQGKVWHVDSETFPRHHWWTHVCVV